MPINRRDEFNDEIEMTNKVTKIVLPIGIVILSVLVLVFVVIELNKKETYEVIITNDDIPKVPEEPVVEEEKIEYYIELLGDKNMTIYRNNNYIEPGYKATDSKGNDLINEVYVDNYVDIETIGEYDVNYILNDTTVTRKVNVVAGITTLKLIGQETMYLSVNETYKEPGYEVSDTTDGDALKDKVVIVNNIQNGKVGHYQVTYSVTNSSGITSNAIRNVIIMDSKISLTVNNTNWTNQDVTINIHVEDEYFDHLILPNNTKITNKDYQYKISSNGTYKVKAYNTQGMTKEASITISNIDKTNPEGSCSGTYKEGTSTISINASDDNGLAKYVINDKSYTTKTITINSELKTVNVKIYDKAGNVKETSCTLTDKNVYEKIVNYNVANISSKTPIKTSPSLNIYQAYYQKNGQGFTYWLYFPQKVVEGLPLMLFMPGLESLGNDYGTNSYNGIMIGPFHEISEHGYLYNAVVVSPQVKSGTYVQSYVGTYINLLNDIANEFKIDKKKISVMGFSHGCYGLMHIVNQNQNYFSAAVPIGCEPGDGVYPEAFRTTQVWAFVGSGDGSKRLPGFIEQVKAINGGKAWFTWAKVKKHEILTEDYSILRDKEYNVVSWMLSVSRN